MKPRKGIPDAVKGTANRGKERTMYEDFTELGRLISGITREMRAFYDRGLDGFGIGWRQQFYLEYIFDNPGIMPQDLTDRFHVDKGTTTKVMKKLGDEGYITVTADERDHRVRHIFATKRATLAVEKIRRLHGQFHEIIIQELSETDIESTSAHLRQIRENLKNELIHRKKEDGHEK